MASTLGWFSGPNFLTHLYIDFYHSFLAFGHLANLKVLSEEFTVFSVLLWLPVSFIFLLWFIFFLFGGFGSIFIFFSNW
jgi:hypothetical protein